MKQIFLVFIMCGFGISTVAASTLRVTCEDQASGAEISINGKYKGECPIDIQVNEGKHNLKAVKKIDGKNATFQEQVRMGDGVTKRIEVTFGRVAGSAAPAAAIRVDQNAIAQQRYAVEMEEYNRSIQGCLPKFAVEVRRVTQAVNDAYQKEWNACRDFNPPHRVSQTCGPSTWNGDIGCNCIPNSQVMYEFIAINNTDKHDWCALQFTRPKAP